MVPKEVLRADFPGVSFRMDREKLEDESDEEDTRFGAGSLESIVLREASEDLRGAEDGGEEPKKVGKSKGFEFNLCIYRCRECRKYVTVSVFN